LKKHTFKTVSEGKTYPGRKCDVEFTPIGNSIDGHNLVFVGFVQNLIMGNFNGYCEIDGERFEIKNALGSIE
jgi:hypothetical protein